MENNKRRRPAAPPTRAPFPLQNQTAVPRTLLRCLGTMQVTHPTACSEVDHDGMRRSREAERGFVVARAGVRHAVQIARARGTEGRWLRCDLTLEVSDANSGCRGARGDAERMFSSVDARKARMKTTKPKLGFGTLGGRRRGRVCTRGDGDEGGVRRGEGGAGGVRRGRGCGGCRGVSRRDV